jgi:hypothetical protein
MTTLIDTLRAIESLLYRGIELLEPQDRDDDGVIHDALASDDYESRWPEMAAS